MSVWNFVSSAIFSCKSCFQFLTHSPTREGLLCISKFGNQKHLLRSNLLFRLQYSKRINTNNMLTKRIISIQKNFAQFISYFPTASYIWNTLFCTIKESWVCPGIWNQFFQICFKGFDNKKETMTLWQCTVYGFR